MSSGQLYDTIGATYTLMRRGAWLVSGRWVKRNRDLVALDAAEPAFACS